MTTSPVVGSETPPVPKVRQSGLDGLRGIAVLSVVAFHFGASWLPGGFFGVDLFYVLSGFLITRLLLEEARSTGHISLGHFWAGRARRLLPALLLMLLVVTGYVHFTAAPGTYPDFRGDALSALFYVSNWYQIATSANYFVASGAVSPLTHCWSLGVEEQFYLIWPLVTIAVVRRWHDAFRAASILLWICVVGAIASAVEMAILYTPGASTTRIYFGTDTHVQCLLIGAGLACGLFRSGARAGGPPLIGARSQRVADGVGLVALAGLAILAVALTGDSTVTYRGGFCLVAVLAATVIYVVLQAPGGVLARLLSVSPLVGMGRISYAVYLWHFPLAIFLSPARTGLSGVGLAAVRLAATIGIATLSFYLVERPIVERRFWRTVRAVVPAGAGVVGVAVVIVVGTLGSDAVGAAAKRYVPKPVDGASAAGRASPHTVVVLGDSTAETLYYALAATAPVGTNVVNASNPGCGLVIESAGAVFPPQAGPPAVPQCNEASSPSEQWPALDAQAVADTGPSEIVLFLAGHDDTTSALQHGVWTDIRSKQFQAEELQHLKTLKTIATSHGAHLDLLTMPCMDAAYPTGEASLWPSDTVQRRDIYNGLLRKVASESPRNVSLIDYGSILCPKGRFAEFLDGVQVRTPDGIHTPAYVVGGIYFSTEPVAHAFYNWLSPRLWPLITAPSD